MTPNVKITRQQVEEVMGRLDDLKIAEILDTNASQPELLEAKRWIAGYVRTVPDDLPIRPSIVSRLCEILKEDEPDWYDDTAQ
ncbi:MAG: hypothetical protein ACM33T_11780 [Solirubrobacterales bacterium]